MPSDRTEVMELRPFLDEVLPEVGRAAAPLYALFLSYNRIPSHRLLVPEGGHPGLVLHVYENSSYREASDASILELIRARAGHDVSGEANREYWRAVADARDTLRDMTASVEESLSRAPTFAMIYAGITAFDEALALARAMRRGNPNARVAVLTCDCDKREKKARLREMLHAGDIDWAVMDSACGGSLGMHLSIGKLMEVWAESHPAP